jgi:hypothetical protein
MGEVVLTFWRFARRKGVSISTRSNKLVNVRSCPLRGKVTLLGSSFPSVFSLLQNGQSTNQQVADARPISSH